MRVDGYKLEQLGVPGNSWRDRETLDELFDIAQAWDIKSSMSAKIIEGRTGIDPDKFGGIASELAKYGIKSCRRTRNRNQRPP